MDVSRPATVVLPAGVAAVLRVLAGADVWFTGRRLASMSGYSKSYVARVVDHLEEHGLVLVQVQGASKLSRLNRDHLAAQGVINLVTMRTRLFELLRSEIEAWSISPVHASLFGSTARGDGDTKSDLDILLVKPSNMNVDEDDWLNQKSEFALSIETATGNHVAWFDVSEEDLQHAVSNREHIIQAWKDEGILLFGDSFASILRRMK